ncbi:MAG: hypothetical protein JSR72_22920 [Proteobacteria bacterium]|nr:hypothetical protein [Pseudomonadota bacterium]
MPILLYCVGAVAFAIGAAAIGYGIPINEFSFGNTLIISGAVAAMGGLVVLALGVVVSRVQQLTEALARPGAMRSGRVEGEMQMPLRAGVQPAPARAPFPPKPKAPPRPETAAEPAVSPPAEPAPAEAKAEVPPPPPPRPFALPPLPKRPLREQEELAALSPALPNPETDADGERDETPALRTDKNRSEPETPAELAPSPASPGEAEEASVAPAEADEPEPRAAEPAERERRRFEPLGPAPFRAAPLGRASEPFRSAEPVKAESGLFDAMWPAAKSLDGEPAKPKEAATDIAPEKDRTAEDADLAERPREEPRAVAILKSGVVDGMGYTLYVDGSIEAELPQGTLRFASINELRAHLEKSG